MNELDNGLFIVLEGGEGTGKSTMIDVLTALFEDKGHEVISFREPGGTKFSEEVRDLYLSTEGLSGETVAMLMNAARLDNIEKIIKPALNKGKVVIADRFSASTLVYQGIRKGLYDEVLPITQHIPMISMFVDLEPEVGIQRIMENGREVNRLDLLPLETHRVIYEGYHSLSERLPELYWDYVLDGTVGLEDIESYLDKTVVGPLSSLLAEGYHTAEIKKEIRESTKNQNLVLI